MAAEYAAGQSGETPLTGAPALEHGRIQALDVLRGVAVMGILLINLPLFALPPGAYTVPGNTDFSAAADFYVWVFNELFVEGTMRALFSMLFGASLLLMTGALSNAPVPARSLDLYARRSLWLIIFGLIHGYLLLWPYDILYAYGLLGLLLLPLRVLPVRQLILAGLVMLAATALISGMKGGGPGPAGLASLVFSGPADDTFRPDRLPEGLSDVTPTDEEIRLGAARAEAEDALHTRRSGYWDNFVDMAGETARAQTEAFYRTNVFDIGGMILIGMALLKAGALTVRRSRRFYWMMLAGGYGVGLIVNGMESWASVNAPTDSEKLVYWSEVTYDLGRLPMVLGHIGVLMLLMGTRIFETSARLLSAAGRLALTNYVMQTVICNTLFLGAGFGLYGTLSLHQLMILALLIWAKQIAFSMIWLR